MKRKLLFTGILFFMAVINMVASDNKENVKLDSLAKNGIRIIEYVPKDVCSKKIYIEVNKDGIIEKVEFTKGCSGNTKGIGSLIKGMNISEAIKRLKGIKCGNKNTSCPDQLAQALIYIKENK